MGEIYALTCGLAWAFAVILFRKSGESVGPLALNLFRVSISCFLFLMTLFILQSPLFGRAPWQDYAILMISGVIAIAISDTLFHMCLNRVGAGVNAIVDLLYSPFVILVAFFMLGETLSIRNILGMCLIISGVVLTTRMKTPPGIPRKVIIQGVLFGVGAMASLAVGIVMAKPVLERSDVLWATTVRQLGSLMALVPIAFLLPGRAARFSVFLPSKSWGFAIPGTVLGSYFALILWIAGLKYVETGKAAILNQTSTLYILVLASIFLKEPFGAQKALALFLAAAGVSLVLYPS